MTKAVEIIGTIFSDQGLGASFMALAWLQNALEERLGFTAYPATLNVRPDSPEGVARWMEITQGNEAIEIVPGDPSFCRALCFPVEVTAPSTTQKIKIRGAVLWPQIENYPADKMEVIAPVNIKQALSLSDGNRIKVEFL